MQVISIFANLFLQLPFSRRAEAEADLIGMKLMALAGRSAHVHVQQQPWGLMLAALKLFMGAVHVFLVQILQPFSDHSWQHPYLQVHGAKSALPLPAGYDPAMSPETFIKLGKAEAAMRKSMGGNLGALQCTHPRSDSRVQMLQEELALMQVGCCCCMSCFWGTCAWRSCFLWAWHGVT